MFKVIIIVFKSSSSVKWRININALDSSSKILLQRLERDQVIAVNQHVFAVRITVRLLLVVNEDTRFYRLLLIIFTNPSQLKFSFFFYYFIS